MTPAGPITTDIAASVGDDAVDLTLTVRNRSGGPVTLRFRSGQRVDFCAYSRSAADASRSSAPVWRASEGELFTQALATTTLMPAETTQYTERWADPPSGRYRIVGDVTATVDGCDTGDNELRATIDVELP